MPRYHFHTGGADFGFRFGFPPFGFRAWGPWHVRPRRFPRRQEYLQMLEEYRQELEEQKREIEEELKELEAEIANLKQE